MRCQVPTSYGSLRRGWYREFAERAGEPAIWEARLRTAKKLEVEADRVAAKLVCERQETAAQ